MPLRPAPVRRLLPALLLAAFAVHSVAAESTLEERMSYKEFTNYGLDKLTPEQLRGLNAWLNAHGKDCAPGTPAAAAMPGASADASVPPPPVRATPDKVSSRIAGEFRGWKQGTILVLANGQRWEVRDEEPFITSAEKSPNVLVEPGLLSGWTLTVEGHSEIAHVIPSKH
jgi:hypothetical protein